MIKEKLRSLSGLRWTGPLLFGLGLFCVLLLTAQITLYCDDYLYGSFFKYGWDSFWEKTVWHYNQFNGRMFIHFMCQLTLLLDAKLYVVLAPSMLGYIFLAGQSLQGRILHCWLALLTAGAAMLAVLALPLEYIRTCVMWISSAFNYIFPLCVMLAALRLYTREPESKRAWAGILALCFLAGATTEQTGFAACVCIGGWGLLGLARGRLNLKKFLLPVLAAGIGYATIIFAPGTWVRIRKDGGGGLSSLLQPGEFQERLRLSMQYFTGIKGLPALFMAFCLLFALHTALKRKKLLWALPGVGALAVYLLLIFTHHYFFMELFSVLAFLGAAGYYLWKPETTARGLLLLGMLGAQLIMLLNRSAAHRTAVPAILLLLAVCVSLLAECLACLPSKFSWVAPAASALLMLCLLPGYLPTLQGYVKNIPVVQANEQELWDRSDDVVKISLDLDRDYGYLMLQSSDFTLEKAKEYYGITDERIDFFQNGQVLYGFRGMQAGGLPFVVREGEMYASIAATARSCGGEARWVDQAESAAGADGIAVEVGGVSCLFLSDGRLFHWDDANQRLGAELPEGYEVFFPFDSRYLLYAPANVMARLFDLEVGFNEEQGTYYISPNKL